MMINVTMLPSYSYCPRKFFFQHILNIKDTLNDKMLKGRIRHEVFHDFTLFEKNLLTSFETIQTLQEIEQAYIQKYSEIFNNKIMRNTDKLNELNVDIAEFYGKGMLSFVAESKKRAVVMHNLVQKGFSGEALYENVLPKLITELQIISQNLEMKGIVDRIEVWEDCFVPVEIKTGTAPKESVWQGNKVQLAAYCMLLEDYFNKKIRKGLVYYLDCNELRTVFMNPFLKAEVIELRNKVAGLLESKEMPDYCRNELNCRKYHCKNLILKDAQIR